MQENIWMTTLEAGLWMYCTKAGWLWYCDVHDTHGNADSQREAQFMAKAHEQFHFPKPNDNEDGCELICKQIGDE